MLAHKDIEKALCRVLARTHQRQVDETDMAGRVLTTSIKVVAQVTTSSHC